jgi:hypothetical protein
MNDTQKQSANDKLEKAYAQYVAGNTSDYEMYKYFASYFTEYKTVENTPTEDDYQYFNISAGP